MCTFDGNAKQGDRCPQCGFALPYDAAGSRQFFACAGSTSPHERPPTASCRRSKRKQVEELEAKQRLMIESRLAICRSCVRYVNDGRERCGVIVDRGRPGVLLHWKGVPNPEARCELGKWEKQTRD